MINISTELKKVLHAKVREERFTVELLDKFYIKKKDLMADSIRIAVDAENEIKKSVDIVVLNDSDIDWLHDKIAVVYHVKIGKKKWESFKKGVFLPQNPVENINFASKISVTCYDQLAILQQDKFVNNEIYYGGTPYITAISEILRSSGINKMQIYSSNATLPIAIVLDHTKSKLQWVNELLKNINYRELFFNDEGIAMAIPFEKPNIKNIGYEYADDEVSVLLNEKNVSVDLWNVPNVVKVTMSHPELGELQAVSINDDPASKFSTVQRGMKIVHAESVDFISSQFELDRLADRLLFEKQQVSQTVEISTLNMPHHEIYDNIFLNTAEVSGIFQELSWEMTKGEPMKHILRRVIDG